jgi:hypothetical protein
MNHPNRGKSTIHPIVSAKINEIWKTEIYPLHVVVDTAISGFRDEQLGGSINTIALLYVHMREVEALTRVLNEDIPKGRGAPINQVLTSLKHIVCRDLEHSRKLEESHV